MAGLIMDTSSHLNSTNPCHNTMKVFLNNSTWGMRCHTCPLAKKCQCCLSLEKIFLSCRCTWAKRGFRLRAKERHSPEELKAPLLLVLVERVSEKDHQEFVALPDPKAPLGCQAMAWQGHQESQAPLVPRVTQE